MHLFPAIDLRDGQVVRLAQGDYDRQTTYDRDPLEQARLFADAGASRLHVVDLDGARSGRMRHLSVIREICTTGRLKVEVGGGVRTEEAINDLLSAGVERVVLGTAALADWNWFEGLLVQDGYCGKLVLGLDARDGKLAVSGWRRQTDAGAVEVARRVSGSDLAAIVYTDIATDGMMDGPNIDAIRRMTEATRTPVVASGGVGSLDDLKALRPLRIEGVIVGRAIYEDAFRVDEAIRVLEEGG